MERVIYKVANIETIVDKMFGNWCSKSATINLITSTKTCLTHDDSNLLFTRIIYATGVSMIFTVRWQILQATSDNSILVKDRIHYRENKMLFLTFCNENITRQRLEMICLFKFVLIQIVRYYSLTKIRRLIDDDYESFFSFSSQNPPKGPSENKTIEFH